jgi:acylphosphatase
MNQTAKHIIFIGRVQGVGFRFTALDIANRYRLTGLVRNLPDGTVEMLAQGFSDDISDCLRDIEESFRGYIRETKIEEIPSNPQYKDFKITF